MDVDYDNRYMDSDILLAWNRVYKYLVLTYNWVANFILARSFKNTNQSDNKFSIENLRIFN